MIKLIIYDLDGTLVDSLPMVAEILNKIRLQTGKGTISQESLVPWVSLGTADLIINGLDISRSDADLYLDIFRSYYFDSITPKSSLYPHVEYVLKILNGKLGLKVALCTNKPRRLVEKVLSDLNISRYFGFINAGGDLPRRKPAIENALACLQHFSVMPEEAIYVGDSKVDEELAREANIPFVQFLGGYDDGVNQENNHVKITGHKDLINIVNGWI